MEKSQVPLLKEDNLNKSRSIGYFDVRFITIWFSTYRGFDNPKSLQTKITIYSKNDIPGDNLFFNGA